MRKLRLTSVLLLLASTGAAETLHNSDVVHMVHRGLPVSEIIARINAADPGYLLYPEDVQALREEGVPQLVYRAMNIRQTWRRMEYEGSSQPAAPAEALGELSVRAHPGRAGVFLDGKYVGPAANFRMARTYSASAGQHELRLVDPRYQELVTKVDIQAGQKTKVSESLKPLPVPKGKFGVLRVQNPDKFAAVYVNGKFFGHVDEFNNISQGIHLAPGTYEVTIEPLAGRPIAATVTIEAHKTMLVK